MKSISMCPFIFNSPSTKALTLRFLRPRPPYQFQDLVSGFSRQLRVGATAWHAEANFVPGEKYYEIGPTDAVRPIITQIVCQPSPSRLHYTLIQPRPYLITREWISSPPEALVMTTILLDKWRAIVSSSLLANESLLQEPFVQQESGPIKPTRPQTSGYQFGSRSAQ